MLTVDRFWEHWRGEHDVVDAYSTTLRTCKNWTVDALKKILSDSVFQSNDLSPFIEQVVHAALETVFQNVPDYPLVEDVVYFPEPSVDFIRPLLSAHSDVAGSAAYFQRSRKPLPEASDVDVWTFGPKAVDETRRILTEIQRIRPDTHILFRGSVCYVTVPGLRHHIQVITTKFESMAEILHHFDLGYCRHSLCYMSRSTTIAFRTKCIAVPIQSLRALKWVDMYNVKTQPLLTRPFRDYRNHKFYHVPFPDPNPKQTHHILRGLFGAEPLPFTQIRAGSIYTSNKNIQTELLCANQLRHLVLIDQTVFGVTWFIEFTVHVSKDNTNRIPIRNVHCPIRCLMYFVWDRLNQTSELWYIHTTSKLRRGCLNIRASLRSIAENALVFDVDAWEYL